MLVQYNFCVNKALTLVQLIQDLSYLADSADPDQMASSLFSILFVNLKAKSA